MDDASGLELSLLEGMDEDLLARLHGAGVRTRRDLESRIAGDAERGSLARRIGESEERLAALHFLNFLPPETRAERMLALESGQSERFAALSSEVRRLRRLVAVALFGVVAIVAVVLLVSRPGSRGGSGAASPDSLGARVVRLEGEVERLRPLALAQSETRLMEALGRLGPTPGWGGPLGWALEDDERLASLLGDGDGALRERAASILLTRLALLENARLDSLGPAARAREAAEIAASFPPPEDVTGAWDAAGVLLRQRLRARSLGLAPPDAAAPPALAAAGWNWTAPGFLAAEEYLVRAESLPVRENALPVWSETLVELRRAADLGRDARRDRPEAWARDYWIRRAELEYAVTVAVLARANALPYHEAAPLEFLQQRRAYLSTVLVRAPAEAAGPLRWLLAEYDEAERLLEWMRANPAKLAAAHGKRWVQALEMLEAERARDGLTADPELTARVREALGASGGSAPDGVWSAPRTRWEAGLRPLLMVTRAEARRPSGVSPRSR
jgi:hypothetical protein